VTITATSTSGLTATTFTLTVNNAAPTIALSGADSVNEGALYTLRLGDITDPGSDTVSQYIVNWGDGSSDTYTTPGDKTHTYAGAGTRDITVDLTDEDGTHADRADPLSVVMNAAPTDLALSNASVAENQPVGAVVGTFTTTDPDIGDTFRFGLVSGPGDDDNASFTIDSEGRLLTAASFDWETKSSYSIRVRSTDAGGLYVEMELTINVSDVNEAPAAGPGGPYTVAEGGAVVLSGTGSDPDAGDTLRYAWDLDNDGTFETRGPNPTFSAVGLDGHSRRTVRLRVTDQDGLSADSTASVTITNADPAITAFSVPGTGVEGRAVGLAASASDPASSSDPLQFAWAITRPNGTTFTLRGRTVRFTPADNGLFRVTLTVSDGDGGTATSSALVRVANVAPRLTVYGPAWSNALRPYTLRLASSDPGTDTIRRWVIRWGDGTVQSVPGNPRSVRHLFPLRTGNYTITATAFDEDGRNPATRIRARMAFRDARLAFVADRFFALTGTTIDGVRLGSWAAVLHATTPAGLPAARAMVVWLIRTSPEYRVRLVRSLYRQVLHRNPTRSELG
jgi:hypothetical protein